MKEATGELNMTVITVVAIAAVAAFFYAFVWPGIQNSIKASTYCAQAVCDDSGENCVANGENGSEIWSGNCSKYYKQNSNGGGNGGGN